MSFKNKGKGDRLWAVGGIEVIIAKAAGTTVEKSGILAYSRTEETLDSA